jgi:glycosyltransferase involved in cell wall biosynthesis
MNKQFASVAMDQSGSGPAQPLVSVAMAVYNEAEFLAEALESIRSQTYASWELICWDDGSSDGSWEILEGFALRDRRIRVFRDGIHRGVAGAANRAISNVRGELVARMDADDVAYPDRLERQVAYLRQHPEAVAVGGQCLLIDRRGNALGEKLFPTSPIKVRRMIFSTIPIQQPTMVVSCKRLPDGFIWYREGTTVAIEVELIFRLFQYGQVGNVEQAVLKYRIHEGNISLRHPKKTFLVTLRGRVKAVFAYGYRPTITGVLITLAQTVVVLLLPERWIYPVYALAQRLRGLSSQRSPGVPPLGPARRESRLAAATHRPP